MVCCAGVVCAMCAVVVGGGDTDQPMLLAASVGGLLLLGMNALIFKLAMRSAVLQSVVLLALELGLLVARLSAPRISILVVVWLALSFVATLALVGVLASAWARVSLAK